MIEPIEIDVSAIMQILDTAVNYALATCLVIVFAGATYAAGMLIIQAVFGDDEE